MKLKSQTHFKIVIGIIIFVCAGSIGVFLLAAARKDSKVSSTTLLLTDAQDQYTLGTYLEYLEDPSGQLTLAQVTSPLFANQFTASNEESPNFGYTSSTYWFRFDFVNRSPKNEWLLELSPSSLDQIDLYIIDHTGQTDHREAGDRYPFAQREVDHHNFVFNLNLPPDVTQSVYIRIENTGRTVLSAHLWDYRAFAQREFYYALIGGAGIGALLIMAAYHFLLAFTSRDKLYFYYSLYIVLILLMGVSSEGIFYQYLSPNWPYINSIFGNITIAASGIVLFVFSLRFLQVKSHSLTLYRFIQIIIGLHVFVLLALFVFDQAWIKQLTALLGLVDTLTALGTGMYISHQGYRPARYYLTSWGIYLIGITSTVLVMIDLLPATPLTNYLGTAMIVPALLLLSMGLADRMNLLKHEKLQAESESLRMAQENERLVREQNVILEQKVLQRTEKLRQSEERFAAVTNSIEAIIYVADMESYEVLFLNRYAHELFGEVEGKKCWQTLQTGQSGPCDFCTNPYLVENGKPTGIYTWETRNTTTKRWYHLQDQAIHWVDGRLVRIEVATDITNLKETEIHKQQLAALEERELIGRELHDDLAQVIGYLNLQSQAIRELLAQGKTEQAQTALKKLADVAQKAHTDIRQFILGIRMPVDYPDLAEESTDNSQTDFLSLLENYLKELESLYNFQVDLSLPDADTDFLLSPDVGTQVLRIIQEALTNIRKYAGVASARIYLFSDHDYARVIIEDKGSGFDLKAGKSDTERAGLSGHGLQIMRERAASMGGTLKVHTQPGEGTQITLQMPPLLATGDKHNFIQGLRVLLVDDHPLFLEGLRALLSARGLQIIGTAQDGLDAQEKARALLPDLILMDFEMPHCDGIEATRQIKAELPEIRIVLLTVAANDDTIFAALKAGVSGYLLKDLASDDFYYLLQNLVRGEAVFSPQIATRMLQEFNPAARNMPVSPALFGENLFPELTSQQVKILDLVAQGSTYKEVAAEVHLTERTIRYHMSQILERLQLQSRKEAVKLARHKGLGQLE